jgi:hypothetical protein
VPALALSTDPAKRAEITLAVALTHAALFRLDRVRVSRV